MCVYKYIYIYIIYTYYIWLAVLTILKNKSHVWNHHPDIQHIRPSGFMRSRGKGTSSRTVGHLTCEGAGHPERSWGEGRGGPCWRCKFCGENPNENHGNAMEKTGKNIENHGQGGELLRKCGHDPEIMRKTHGKLQNAGEKRGDRWLQGFARAARAMRERTTLYWTARNGWFKSRNDEWNAPKWNEINEQLHTRG